MGSKIREILDRVSEWLNEQVWFQQLRGKWEELDPQSRHYLRFAAFGGSVLTVFLVVLSALLSVRGLKKDLSEKIDLLSMLQGANEEIRRLRDTNSNMARNSEESSNWSTVLDAVATAAGVDRASLTITGEKAGQATDTSKETLFEVDAKHLNIKQVVRLAFALENGARPVKVRNLTIDTKGDVEGYMDATYQASGFSLVSK